MCSLSQYDTSLQAWSNRANQPQTETSKSMAPNKPFLSTSCFTQGMCYSDVKIMQGVQEQENYTENKPKSHTILRYYSRTNQETTVSSMKRSQSNQTAQHERYLLIVLTTQVWSKSFPLMSQVHLTSIHRPWYCASSPNKKYKSCNAKVKSKRPDQTISLFNLLTILHQGARELV